MSATVAAFEDGIILGLLSRASRAGRKRKVSSVDTVTLHLGSAQKALFHAAVLWCAEKTENRKKKKRRGEKKISHMGRVPESVLFVFWHRCESEVRTGLC